MKGIPSSSAPIMTDSRALENHGRNMARLAELLDSVGLPVKRGPPAARTRLSRFPAAIRHAVTEGLGVFLDVCEEAIREGESPLDDRRLLWHFLGRLRLRPSDDLFEKIDDGDIIEIYDRQCLQVFRNLEFFSVSSYSIDELIYYPMPELFERDSRHTEKLLAEFDAVLHRGAGTLRSSVPPHSVRETFSSDRLRARAEQKYLSPLRDHSGSIQAVATTIRLDIVASGC